MHGFSELSDVNPQIRVLNPLSLLLGFDFGLKDYSKSWRE
jgi:hypothetical protein